MATQRLVDGEALAKLLDGSFEVVRNEVDEAVSSNLDLFGGDSDDEIRVIGTFSEHAIVVNESGEFFKVELSRNEETGDLELGTVEQVQVPVKEASELSGDAKVESLLVVDAILDGNDDEADARIESLYTMARSGVKFTAEGVEDDLIAMGDDHDWIEAVRENEESMAKFVGSDANRALPKPKFNDLFESAVDRSDQRIRDSIQVSLDDVLSELRRMHVDVESVMRSGFDENMTSGEEGLLGEDFGEFVHEFSENLEDTIGIVESAIAVADGGDVMSLGRVHDGVASRLREMNLAAAFSEKFVSHFLSSTPQA